MPVVPISWVEKHDTLIRQNNQLRAENDALLAANRDVMLHFDVLKADYDRLQAALREVLEYEGGEFCVCDDPYVMERARAALNGEGWEGL